MPTSEPPDAVSISSIFGGLPDLPPFDDQSDSLPFVHHFAAFLRASQLHLDAARALDALVSSTAEPSPAQSPEQVVAFFPTYGAAVLALCSSSCCSAEPTASLTVVGPDSWAFGMRDSRVAAESGGFLCMVAGAVPKAELAALLAEASAITAPPAATAGVSLLSPRLSAAAAGC